ncbi:TIGR04076 family protein [Chloroflexota bacterium]
MAERYKVHIKVISQQGKCTREHKVGDEWLMEGKIPGGLCPSACHAIYPDLRVLMFGGSLPWESDPEAATVACPDGKNPVVFKLRRIRE